MNFFEQQHRARRHTWLMVLLFVLAVAAIVAVLDLVGVAIYIWIFDPPILYSSNLLQAVPHRAYGWSTAVILGVMAWGTGRRLYQLSGGGVAVADMIGARHMKRDTGEPSERRLLNIVEEMALASGIAVPLVFVMDDQRTINAFAAGYSPHEAAVIVTRGALEELNRDELQGVVAHEFSHILNGDMRLNVILVGVIAGIVLFGSLGAAMMIGGRRERDGETVGAGFDLRAFFIGLVLWIIGSIGVFAGRLIKAVIARQREFLADASAVQFTRNPDGIGNALFKIGRRGSVIVERHAEELSHMCIGAPVNDYFEFAWLSTHPPLDQRIERILGPGAKRPLHERMGRAGAASRARIGDPDPEAAARTRARRAAREDQRRDRGRPQDHARRIRAAHAVQNPDPEGAQAPAGREVPQRRRGGNRGSRRALAARALRQGRDGRVRQGNGRPRRSGRGAALAFRAEHRGGGERPQRAEPACTAKEAPVHQGLRRDGDGR